MLAPLRFLKQVLAFRILEQQGVYKRDGIHFVVGELTKKIASRIVSAIHWAIETEQRKTIINKHCCASNQSLRHYSLIV